MRSCWRAPVRSSRRSPPIGCSGTRTVPVLVTGLPGISIPAIRPSRPCPGRLRSLRAAQPSRDRRVHQHSPLNTRSELIFGLASLPFLSEAPDAPMINRASRSVDLRRAGQSAEPTRRSGADPAGPGRRRFGGGQVARRRRRAADPPRAVAVPGAAGRPGRRGQDQLRPPSGLLGGSMDDALCQRPSVGHRVLDGGLEAMAVGLPTLIISDFGVSAEMINIVFDGSGCLGTPRRPPGAAGSARPDPAWLEANYFHADADNDWLDRLDELLARRAAAGLPVRGPTGSLPARVRRRVRLLLPAGAGARFVPCGLAAARCRKINSHSSRTAPWPPGSGQHQPGGAPGRRAGHRPPRPARPPRAIGPRSLRSLPR